MKLVATEDEHVAAELEGDRFLVVKLPGVSLLSDMGLEAELRVFHLISEKPNALVIQPMETLLCAMKILFALANNASTPPHMVSLIGATLEGITNHMRAQRTKLQPPQPTRRHGVPPRLRRSRPR